MTWNHRRWKSVAGWVVLAVTGGLAIFLLFHDLRHDDAFLTFRHARNLATGRGFGFHPGEPLLATTSPLHTLLLAVGCLICGECLPTLAVLLGGVALAFQSVFLYLWLRPVSGAIAGGLALLTFAGLASPFAYLTLETHLVAALILATLWALSSERGVWCGVLLGLAFLARYDAVLLVPFVAGAAWYRRPALAKRILLTSFLTVLPWLVWATLYFGTFLPETFFAKLRITPPLEYLRDYVRFFAAVPWSSLGVPSESATAMGLWVSPILWMAGLYQVARHSRRVLLLVGFAGSLLLLYALIGPPSPQRWHLYPVTFTSVLLAAYGILAGLQRLVRRPQAVLGVGIVLSLGVGVVTVRRVPDVVDGLWTGWRHDVYTQVAVWVDDHVRPEATFLAEEVGTVGYLTDRRMIDPFGLVNPTNEFPQSRSMPDLVDLIQVYRPGVVLAPTPEAGYYLENTLGYRVVKVFEWERPWSTVLIRDPTVLVEPSELSRLRAQLDR